VTADVAQVFVTDDGWAGALGALAGAVRPGGRLAFETRDPTRRAWERWTPEHPRRTVTVPGAGAVTTWTELVEVALPLVSFRHVFCFGDAERLTSDSTLRFRVQDEVVEDLRAAGFDVRSIHDAPDRPGLEHIYVAQRATG